MPLPWPRVRLGDILTLSREPTPVDRTSQYPNIGILSFGRGVFRKQPIEGATTSASTLYRIHSGQFIYSRLFAFEGAYAVVPQEFEGYFVSNEFPTFDCDQNRLLPGYLEWLFKQLATWKEIAGRSTGIGHRRQRVHPEELLEHVIYLPPLAEQQRIAALIESFAARIIEASQLREETLQDSEALCRSILYSDTASVPTPMGELVRLRPPDVIVRVDETYQFAGVYSFGRGVFKAERRTGLEFSYPRLTRLRTNDFVYPKLMAWEGALAVVPKDCDGCVVSTEFPVFEIVSTRIIPEVLDTYFRNPEVWPQISGASTGTNVRRRRLNPDDFLSYVMPLPSPSIQQRLRVIRQELADMQPYRDATAHELRTLLPTIVERALRGELVRAA